MTLPVIVLGAGGHAKVLIDILKLRSTPILGVTDPKLEQAETTCTGVPVLGPDQSVLSYSPDQVRLVNGLGSVGPTTQRRNLFEQFRQSGYQFATVIHPSAVVASDATISVGVQIMAGAVVQPGVFLGENTIVNTRASVDHDSYVGAHVHLAPGVTLSGGVQIADGVHVGTGATVIQGIRVGEYSVIGAGAVVIRDVTERTTVVGVPAREVVTP